MFLPRQLPSKVIKAATDVAFAVAYYQRTLGLIGSYASKGAECQQ